MQNQPLATVALSTIDWFDGTDKSNTMSWLEQVEVVAERNNQAPLEGLIDNYVRWRASKDAENWKAMADAFDSIAKIARMAGKTKAYNKPRYEKSTDIHTISQNSYNSQRGSFSRYQGTYRSNNGNNRNNGQNNSHQAAGNNLHRQNSSKESVCYH